MVYAGLLVLLYYAEGVAFQILSDFGEIKKNKQNRMNNNLLEEIEMDLTRKESMD